MTSSQASTKPDARLTRKYFLAIAYLQAHTAPKSARRETPMKTVKDLLIAMINATLILVALCLFLLWQLSRTGERVVASFAQNLQIVEPLEMRVADLRNEVAGLRTDLSAISLDNVALGSQARQRLQNRAEAVQTELVEINQSLASLADTPDRLLQTALDDAAARVGNRLGAIASCYAPETIPDAVTSSQ